MAPLTVVVAGGVIFVAFVLLFTNARNWLSDQTTINRATLHLAPLVAIWMLAVFRAWTQTLREPEAIEPPPDIPAPATVTAP